MEGVIGHSVFPCSQNFAETDVWICQKITFFSKCDYNVHNTLPQSINVTVSWSTGSGDIGPTIVGKWLLACADNEPKTSTCIVFPSGRSCFSLCMWFIWKIGKYVKNCKFSFVIAKWFCKALLMLGKVTNQTSHDHDVCTHISNDDKSTDISSTRMYLDSYWWLTG